MGDWDTTVLSGPEGEDWRVPVSELENRLERLARALRVAALPGALIQHPVDLYYFAGGRQDGSLFVPAEGTEGDGPAFFVRRSLERDGYDVYLRGVRAYSTGGWFRDPVLSTMLPYRSDHGTWYLINVLFHELTHANVLVNDQSTFNESVASFVGDMMAREYLRDRFGAQSEELKAFEEELEEDEIRGAMLTAAYKELEALYASNESKAAKLASKRKIMARVETELGLRSTPNNAMMAGFRTYNEGVKEFEQLYAHCGRDWTRFLKAVRQIDEDSFPEEQLDDIGPIIAKRLKKPCKAARTARR